MAPGILLNHETEETGEVRPSKRVKLQSAYNDDPEEHDGDIPSHPLGIKPSGNAYSSDINSKASAGLFARLPDELVLQILETLGAKELLILGSSCRYLYAFTHFDELWRALFVE